MSEKSDKLRAMLEKEKERRIKLNNRIEILERRIQEEDSAEVNEMVRTAKVRRNSLPPCCGSGCHHPEPGCAVCRRCNFREGGRCR